MNWFTFLDNTHPVAQALFVLSVVALCGLLLGYVRVWGISLGIAGVLFAGIAFGHFGWKIDMGLLEFTRDFGLVLFVYTIGMQVGPGFFQSLRKQGLPLNALALGTVGSGAILALLIGRVMHFPIAAVAGLFSGATTNTPSLGAAQEALKRLPDVSATESAMPALAYAAAYPFGIVGIILSMLFLRWLFEINPKAEAIAFLSEQGTEQKLKRLNIRIQSPAFENTRLVDWEFIRGLGVIVTRVLGNRTQTITTATNDTLLHVGDIVLAVGSPEPLDELCNRMGSPSPVDLMRSQGKVIYREVTVTRSEVIGRTLASLRLENLYPVTISRIKRARREMTAGSDVELQFGDRVRVVGEPEAIESVSAILGNSADEMNHTRFVSVFLGIGLGVLLGSIPLSLPGMPAPISLGLAGGPLVVAIILSRLGRVGPLIWYMPLSANLALREFGITLFLACVGLKAGAHFMEILLHGDGLWWMVGASIITVVPLLMVGLIARLFMRLNFMNICGVLAGTMTDPPALAFANNISDSEAPATAYATVYPLSMLLRILLAQGIILFFR